MKSLICDVVTDSHLIGGTSNRTINPQKRIFPWKWSDSSVMSYLYIADKKGERFNHVAGRITYFTEVFTKPLLLAKMKSLFCDVISDYPLCSFPSECDEFLNQHRTHPFQSTPIRLKSFINEKSVLPLFWKHVFHIYFWWTYVSAERIKTCEYISKQNPRSLLILGPLIHYSAFQ